MIRIDKEVNSDNISEIKSGGVSGGVKPFDAESLCNAIKENPGLNLLELLKVSELSKRTLERWLKKLKDQNKVEFKGAPKTGGYFIK